MAATVPVTAYYGEASSCIKHELHPIDWQHAMTRPDAARWSLSAQSGAIIDKTLAGRTAANVAKFSYPPAMLLI